MPAARLSLMTSSQTLPKPQPETASLFQLFFNKKLLGKTLGLGESFDLLLLGKRELFTVKACTTADGQHYEQPQSAAPPKETPTEETSPTNTTPPSAPKTAFLVTDHTTVEVIWHINEQQVSANTTATTEQTHSKRRERPAVLVADLHAAEIGFLVAFVQQALEDAGERLPRFKKVLVAASSRAGKSAVLARLEDELRGGFDVTTVDFEDSGVLSVAKNTNLATTVLREVSIIAGFRIYQKEGTSD